MESVHLDGHSGGHLVDVRVRHIWVLLFDGLYQRQGIRQTFMPTTSLDNGGGEMDSAPALAP